MSNSKKIVSVIGDIFCDVLVTNFTSIPPWGTDAEAHIIFAAGGSALNTVLHGANFSCLKEKNVCFALYSAVGNDIQGEICLNAIGGKEDILNYIYKSTAYATGTCIVISATSDRLFFSDRGCVDQLTLSWFDKSQLLNCSHLHCAGYFNCSKLREEISLLFEEAITMGITTSLNPQYDRTGQWTGLEFLSRYITVFICNEIEALSITGEVVVHQAAEILLSWGCKIVVLTSSKQSNAYVQRCCRTIIFSQPCYYLNDIVDTTGAGDAFIGAFLTEWTRHELIKWNLEHIELDLLASFVKQCLRAGNLAGACAVSVKGASSTVDGSFMATIEQCPLHDVNAAEEFGMY